jgi:hypothetical protein
MQGGSRLKGRFAARFAGRVSIDYNENEEDHFQFIGEQISSFSLFTMKSESEKGIRSLPHSR